MKSDIEIAQEARMKPIAEIAASLGLADEDVIPYGRYKAKINHRLIHKAGKVSQHRLCDNWRHHFSVSHLSCTCNTESQYQARVKLHGVFPSWRR